MIKSSHMREGRREETGSRFIQEPPHGQPRSPSCLHFNGPLPPILTSQPAAPAEECPGPSSSPSMPCQRQPGSRGHSLYPWAKRAARENMQIPVDCKDSQPAIHFVPHLPIARPMRGTGGDRIAHQDSLQIQMSVAQATCKGCYDTGTTKLLWGSKKGQILILGEGDGNR